MNKKNAEKFRTNPFFRNLEVYFETFPVSSRRCDEQNALKPVDTFFERCSVEKPNSIRCRSAKSDCLSLKFDFVKVVRSSNESSSLEFRMNSILSAADKSSNVTNFRHKSIEHLRIDSRTKPMAILNEPTFRFHWVKKTFVTQRLNIFIEKFTEKSISSRSFDIRSVDRLIRNRDDSIFRLNQHVELYRFIVSLRS